MQVPLEITYRNVQKTEAIENLITERITKLEKVCDYIVSCRVAVEAPQQHQQTGNPFRVRIDIRVPKEHELVIKRESSQGNVHGTLPQTLRDAFDAAQRQLKELVKIQRAEVKTHPAQQNLAFVVRLFKEEGYGFIKTGENREIYFHKNSVLNNGWDRLEIGTGVRFSETPGEKGPQATAVQIVDKPGVRAARTAEPVVRPPMGWHS
jgi:cold shock CspA family protein/ribosome-associated translation inhibitor RaiA